MNTIIDTSELSLPACDDGFDLIEDRLRANIRSAIEAVFNEELDAQLLWLPPVVQEFFLTVCACDRLRASFRPILSGVSRSRGRYGDQQIGSKSSTRPRRTKLGYGFPNPDLRSLRPFRS